MKSRDMTAIRSASHGIARRISQASIMTRYSHNEPLAVTRRHLTIVTRTVWHSAITAVGARVLICKEEFAAGARNA